jgi:signal recognition particle subunit SRP14
MLERYIYTCICIEDTDPVIDSSRLAVSRGQDAPKPTEADPFPDLHPEAPLPIIVRASNAKSKDKRKARLSIATVVDPEALDVFYSRYAEVCKTGMAALKPRDRTKRKAKAKKKKGAAGPATVAAAS